MWSRGAGRGTDLIRGRSRVSGVGRGTISRLALFAQLDQAARITEVSAPAGSGKSTLLRSWIDETGRSECAACVSVRGEGLDPQRFWVKVADALRGTAAGSALVRPLTPAPDLDGWVVVERLLADLSSLRDRTWLVIDDLHELASTEALRQIELLLMRAPVELRFVLATRHDLPLGLHRLRLEGELTEIRAASLQFTLAETQALFETAGISLSEPALVLLHRRTEGWAAGLRLAALSLAGHPDPDKFAAEFSGSERIVAEYLMAEVLERQPEPVRLLLLRTSVLERVNGELADLLTGASGGERILLDLEAAGAFVSSAGPHRSWFRYHRLFADLLQLKLRRTFPTEPAVLHAAAARWYAEHGYPVDAVRHGQAAQDWALAARLLSDHWVDLDLNGQAGTARELLAGFPAGVAAGDAELTALMAARDLGRGSPHEAERRLVLAARGAGTVPADRRGQFDVMCTVMRLQLARRRGDLPAVAEEADRLLAAVEAADPVRPALGDDLRALALVNLGSTEVWAPRRDGADRHLDEGITLARLIGRPYLELTGLAHDAQLKVGRSGPAAERLSRQAIDLAGRHGWSEEPVLAVAWAALANALIVQGRLAEAEPWLEQAERTLRPEVHPVAAVMNLHFIRGALGRGRGQHAAALAALQACEKLTQTLVTPHVQRPIMRANMLHALIRLGQGQQVEQALAEMDAAERDSEPMRLAEAVLRLSQDDPAAAAERLGPVLGGVRPDVDPVRLLVALLLEAQARAALGRADHAGRALELALDAAAPGRWLYPFLVYPVPDLLEAHARSGTAHGPLIGEVLGLLGVRAHTAPPAAPLRYPQEPLTFSENRVLRYLPTNLTAPEIAAELSLSVSTVRTHMRHLYEKLGAHTRSEAVEFARSLGLVAPAARA
jgi:LuxR family transcriptional regulator, maltose regulon positive regulatory protein